IALNAVAEDDSVFWHLRFDEQRLLCVDTAKDESCLRRLAWQWFAHGEAKIVGVPREFTFMREFRRTTGLVRRVCSEALHDARRTRQQTFEPARRADAGGYNHAARRMIFRFTAGGNFVSRRKMRARPDKQIVHRIEFLA